MKPDALIPLWERYLSAPIDLTIHPDDHMHAHNKLDMDAYLSVGRSGAAVIFAALATAQISDVSSILDFGCGHGRVARHIRAMFPDAEVFFSDVDLSCVEFCSTQFDGQGIVSPEDLGTLSLPKGMDVIFAGSVFTHIRYERMKILFDKLYETLNPGGAMILTFRGPRSYEAYKATPHQAAEYADLLSEYERTGIAFQSYGMEQHGDEWGLSQTSIEAIVKLGTRHKNARLIGYSEAGWANIQDVGVWSRW